MKPKELAENCDIENKEKTSMMDVFIANPTDPEIQNELHEQMVEPRQLELAINMELGMRNQHQIQQHNKTLIPDSVNTIQHPPSTRLSNWSISNKFDKQGNRSTVQILLEIGLLITATNASPKANLQQLWFVEPLRQNLPQAKESKIT